MATARPTVSVFKHDDVDAKKQRSVKLPQVFSAPLRSDLVKFVHYNMSKNKRQAMGLKDESGYDTAAASWGTGRAVARIPRVPGGGTHRSGQGAFGNMCRGGGMFNPTKTWRKWHRRINTTQKRHAAACAIAATAVPALVMARGHKVDEVPEMPLVVSQSSEKIKKTKDALKLLTDLGCADELEKTKQSKKLRRGKGKIRNRRYVMRKGPLVIYSEKDASLPRAMRNIPGVDVQNVNRLNLLQLAPGGHFGRFVIYTEGAVKKLAPLFGTYKGGSHEKKGYTLPRSMMTNTDIARIINSNEVQSVLNAAKEGKKSYRVRKNPLKNRSQMGKLCPGHNQVKKVRKDMHTKDGKIVKSVKKRVAKVLAASKKHGKAKKAFFRNLLDAYKPAAPVEEEEAEE